jgi:hypothetical protein
MNMNKCKKFILIPKETENMKYKLYENDEQFLQG